MHEANIREKEALRVKLEWTDVYYECRPAPRCQWWNSDIGNAFEELLATSAVCDITLVSNSIYRLLHKGITKIISYMDKNLLALVQIFIWTS